MFLVLILCLQFAFAGTTFFEGDLGYNDDFIMGEIVSEEVVETIPEAEELSQGGGGKSFVQLDKALVCEVCSESLRKHINYFRDIDYSEEEIEILSLEITEETGVTFSHEQVAVLIEDFEKECSLPYPLLGGLAGGRLRDLSSPLIIFIGVLILGFFIFLYFMFRRIRKIKSNIKKKSSKKKKRKKK